MQAPEVKRPIRMIAQDVKLLGTADLRETCTMLFFHMQQAFGGISFQGQSIKRARTNMAAERREQAAAAAMRTGSGGQSGSPRAGSGLAGQLSSGSFEGRGSLGGGGGEGREDAGQRQGLSKTGREATGQLSHGTDSGLRRWSGESDGEGGQADGRPEGGVRQSSGSGPTGGSRAVGLTGGIVTVVSGNVNTPAQEQALLQLIMEQNNAQEVGKGPKSVLTGAPGADDGEPETPVSYDASELSEDSNSFVSAGSTSRFATGSAATSPAARQAIWDELQLEYEIEFVQVQVNMVSESAAGSLVLGTNTALLMGHLAPARKERTVTFKMDQVQAHVVDQEIDPNHGPCWLDIANGKLSIPRSAEFCMKQVLLPFKVREVGSTSEQGKDWHMTRFGNVGLAEGG